MTMKKATGNGHRDTHIRGPGTSHVILSFPCLGSSRHGDLAAAAELLDQAVERTEGRVVEVELHARCVGASFVGIVAGATRRLERAGRRLRLTNVAPGVREVFAVCGYDRLVHPPPCSQPLAHATNAQ